MGEKKSPPSLSLSYMGLPPKKIVAWSPEAAFLHPELRFCFSQVGSVVPVDVWSFKRWNASPNESSDDILDQCFRHL